MDVFLSVFGGQVWTVENAAKTLVWTKNFLSIFKKQKTEVSENALVWTGPQSAVFILHSEDRIAPKRTQIPAIPSIPIPEVPKERVLSIYKTHIDIINRFHIWLPHG